MILKRTSLAMVAGLLLLTGVQGLCCSSLSKSKPRELRFQRHDSALRAAVDRELSGPAGTTAVMDVESAKILAAKNLKFAGRQLIWPGSTLKPLVLVELVDSGKLDPNERLICWRPLRIGGMPLDGSHTAEVSQLDADDAIAYSNSCVAEVALRLSGDQLAEALRRRGPATSSVPRIKNNSSSRPSVRARWRLLRPSCSGLTASWL